MNSRLPHDENDKFQLFLRVSVADTAVWLLKRKQRDAPRQGKVKPKRSCLSVCVAHFLNSHRSCYTTFQTRVAAIPEWFWNDSVPRFCMERNWNGSWWIIPFQYLHFPRSWIFFLEQIMSNSENFFKEKILKIRFRPNFVKCHHVK